MESQPISTAEHSHNAFRIDTLEVKIAMLEKTVTDMKHTLETQQTIINNYNKQKNNERLELLEQIVFWGAVIIIFKY